MKMVKVKFLQNPFRDWRFRRSKVWRGLSKSCPWVFVMLKIEEAKIALVISRLKPFRGQFCWEMQAGPFVIQWGGGISQKFRRPVNIWRDLFWRA
ncbi:MAG: hypothetical protein ABSH28_01815 [Acidobacteriota bacterium]|jgi:hypothetical protein